MSTPSDVQSAIRRKNPSLSNLMSRLRGRSRKVTGPRQAILDLLRRHPHPLSNKEIFAALPPGECDLATVYRSMHLLRAMGLVKRFDFGDGVARFELLADGDDGHHHHLICTQCAIILEVDECFPRELEEKLAAKNGFQTVTHKLEFFGVCRQCQPTANKK
ncbi:MAG: transcriptional repressor [Verrucomicrobia bacterium]|nr:transcriptional repressor [Verrucomicrobiota bacterium]